MLWYGNNRQKLGKWSGYNYLTYIPNGIIPKLQLTHVITQATELANQFILNQLVSGTSHEWAPCDWWISVQNLGRYPAAFLTVTRYRRGTPLRAWKVTPCSIWCEPNGQRVCWKKNLARGGSHVADHVPQQERWELLQCLAKIMSPQLTLCPLAGPLLLISLAKLQPAGM